MKYEIEFYNRGNSLGKKYVESETIKNVYEQAYLIKQDFDYDLFIVRDDKGNQI